jgi:hypothetical protein
MFPDLPGRLYLTVLTTKPLGVTVILFIIHRLRFLVAFSAGGRKLFQNVGAYIPRRHVQKYWNFHHHRFENFRFNFLSALYVLSE